MEIPVGFDLPEGGEVVFSVAGVFLPEGWVPLNGVSAGIILLDITDTQGRETFKVVASPSPFSVVSLPENSLKVPPTHDGGSRSCLVFVSSVHQVILR